MSSDMNGFSKDINEYLKSALKSENAPKQLVDAMQYSLNAGGKRIRPALFLEFYRLLGGNPETVMNFAAAIEMIHTYSLIHDDLPCMDNDDMRRGRPSNHKVYGEDIALLAGDALLTEAFYIASDIDDSIDSKCALKAINLLSNAAGMRNMVGGQVLDLASENKLISLEELAHLQDGKTVAMIKVSAEMACVLINAEESERNALLTYCECVGKAFQIRDDILDVIGDSETFGKPIGSDSENNKNTYISLIGLEASQQLVEDLTNKAIDALLIFDNADELINLAKSLSTRNT